MKAEQPAVNESPQSWIVWQTPCREGTVGRTLPGVAARIVDPETGGELGADCEGLLQLQGPNVMLGRGVRPCEAIACVCRGYDNSPSAQEPDSPFPISTDARPS
jgi:hypothetical protein